MRLLRRTAVELRAGQTADAERTLASVAALAPDSVEVVRWLGVIAQVKGDQAKALDCFRRVMTVWPNDSALHVGLGIALFMTGAVDDGLAHLRKACELAPSAASAWFNLGEALKQDAHTEESIEALRKAVSLDPAHVGARLSLARAKASAGEIDAAVKEFREVLRRDSENARAWFGLSNLNTVRFDVEDTGRIQKAFARTAEATESHDLLGFALAKALEDQGDFHAAFEAFKVANASQRRRVKWDAAAERRRVEAILRVSQDWSPPRPIDPDLGREVILIVSIPRSGSSLIEHILASHPEVEGANEIKDLRNVIDAETRRRHDAFPLWVPMATAGDWQRLGREYLAATARWRERKPRFTDKNLITWYLVGPALAMLPAARVVIVRRDPLETCLACYRQWFTGDAGFAYDLDEMADYCIDFMRVTSFWLEKFPDRVFDLEYEALIAEPETTIRRLLGFCGLSFDPACLEFHRTERTVLSAPSAAQVRQPLCRNTARAGRYGDKLNALRARLRAAGLA
ncbi:MAG: tetratricopeptide repeat-containing sulfotransferase family protein [Rhodanobacteraceae bacterium]